MTIKRAFSKICLLTALILSFLSVAASTGANLLVNGDYETGEIGQFGSVYINGWTTWGTGGAHDDWFSCSGGSKSIRLWSNEAGIYQDFDVSGGSFYQIDAYATSTSGDNPLGWSSRLMLEWFNADSVLIDSEFVGWYTNGEPFNVWKHISGSYQAPADADYGRAALVLVDINDWYDNEGSIGWDQLSVECIPEPSSLMLVLSGLLVFTGFSFAKR